MDRFLDNKNIIFLWDLACGVLRRKIQNGNFSIENKEIPTKNGKAKISNFIWEKQEKLF